MGFSSAGVPDQFEKERHLVFFVAGAGASAPAAARIMNPAVGGESV
jgi:hypothetical protein